jgi:hypothetical protein
MGRYQADAPFTDFYEYSEPSSVERREALDTQRIPSRSIRVVYRHRAEPVGDRDRQ